MAQTPKQGELFPEVNALDGTTLVNARCLVRTQDGHRVSRTAVGPIDGH